MRAPTVHKGKRAHRILMLLQMNGPMTHAELADGLGIKEIQIDHDYKELKEKKESGERMSPPRNYTRIYPGMSRLLSYMSRRGYLIGIREEEFMEEIKPLLTLREEKWEITKWGIEAIERLHK